MDSTKNPDTNSCSGTSVTLERTGPSIYEPEGNLNPYPAKLIYLNFQLLEVMSRYRDPQLEVAENYSYLFNLSTNICKVIPITVIWSTKN